MPGATRIQARRPPFTKVQRYRSSRPTLHQPDAASAAVIGGPTRFQVVCCRRRPAPPPNKRMNPTLLFFELTNAVRQRKSQTFHHSSARPARRVIRRAVRRP